MSGPLVKRSVDFDDCTPRELALLFSHMHSDEQAQFFSEIWEIAKAWPGAGWCQQSYSIAENIDRDGRSTIETLVWHVIPESAAAPDLLAAAQEAFEFLGGVDGVAGLRGKLLAALNKATGQ